MLVLSRKTNESIVIDNRIVITILRVEGNKIRLGIEAPPDLLILRKELEPHAPPAPLAASSAGER